jgi:hypothetical protein
MKRCFVLSFIIWLLCVTTAQGTLYLSCEQGNDLYQVLNDKSIPCRRFDHAGQAVAQAPSNAGVLILASAYPSETTTIPPKVFDEAAKKHLRLYIEFPTHLPGMTVGKIQTSPLGRAVVTSDLFGDPLKPMRIMMINGCRFVTVEIDNPHLVLARVAGYDTAVYGLADTPVHPILFELPAGNTLVSATKLSHFVSGRYSPTDAWQQLWKVVLNWLDPKLAVDGLEWTQTVRSMYSRNATLPDDAIEQAVIRGVDWFSHGKFLVGESWQNLPNEQRDNVSEFGPPIGSALSAGDGRFGILEGHASRLDWDGMQQYRYCRRADCQAESALALSMRSRLDRDPRSRAIAGNLMDYLYFTSPLRQGPRNDPKSSSYGLLSWGAYPASSKHYYGDDNARVFLGSIGAAANLNSAKWDKSILELILGNFRTTGKHGFRGPSLHEDQMKHKDWLAYWNSDTVNLHPHFESWIWTSYLWLYDKVGHDILLTRTRHAIQRCMEAYPNWKWTNGIQQERARMILVLAWLIRVDDTAQHRTWLKRVATDMLAHQAPCGGIREEVGQSGGQYGPTPSNRAYGTNEAPLIQENGDPSADMLYTTNFAFFGLQEAAMATGDPFYQNAVTRMADFLIRIQCQSETHPDLDGAWFRGFDMDRWEYWGSNADHGWGVWGTLTGWTQSWIVSTLVLHHQQTSLWDLTKDSKIAVHFDACLKHMLPDDQIQLPEAQRVKHDAVSRIVSLMKSRISNIQNGTSNGQVGCRLD